MLHRFSEFKLEKLFESKGKNQNKYWDQILADNGSVQNLPSDVLNDSDKTVISFCYFSFPPYYEDYKYKFVQTEDFSDENVLNVISSNILEKLN